jgi:hypothetical protein
MTASADHEAFAFDVAPYALGALSASDALAFEEHVASCPLCSAELADVRRLETRLARADEAAFEHPPAVPDTLLPRLLREVHRERRTGSRRAWVLGAVAACLAALLGIATIPRIVDRPTKPLAMHAVASATAAVTATVRLKASGDNTVVELACTYGDSAYGARPDGEPTTYLLVLTDRAGSTVSGPTWTIHPGQSVTIKRTAPWPKDRIQSISLRTDDGREVLALNL